MVSAAPLSYGLTLQWTKQTFVVRFAIVHHQTTRITDGEDHMTSDAMETAIISKTGSGYELSDTLRDRIQIYQSWEPIAEMFRNSDYCEEYITRRKAEVEGGGETHIDETDD
jgi:hypothetical protein